MPRSNSEPDLSPVALARAPASAELLPDAAHWMRTPTRRADVLLATATSAEGAYVAQPAQEAAPPPAQRAYASARLGCRQLVALLRRSWLLKARGWRQTLAEFATPTLLMCALVVGSRLAEITTAEQEVFSNQPPVATLVATTRYAAVSEYFVNHTATACATMQVLLAAAAPSVPPALGLNTAAASAVAFSDPAPTAAVLQAFNLSVGQLLAGAAGGGTSVADAAAALGVSSPGLSDAARAVLADPFNTSAWSYVADAAIAALVSGNATNATSSLGLTVASVIGYNGPLPVPSLDAFVAAHLVVRGLFQRFPPAWAAYKAVKEQLGFNLLGNLVELGGVAFVPDTPQVARLAAALATRHVSWAGIYQGAHADVATARRAAAAGNDEVGPWAVVVFKEVSPAALSYAIRMRYTLVPGTDEVASRFYKGLGAPYSKYYTSGFLTLQRMLDEAALDGALGGTNSTAAGASGRRLVWGTPFPVFAFTRNSFYSSAGPLLGLVMCLSMIYPLGTHLKILVEEKESGARELMRISGLFNWALGTSWALTYVLLYFAVATAATIVLAGSVFPHCAASVIWGMLFLFMLSCVPLGFLISTAFSRARLASIFGPFALFALVLPRYVFFRTTQAQALGGKRAACLLAPTAFTFAADTLARYEAGNSGVTQENVWEGPLSVGECMAWMVLDTAIYSLLAWYFDSVLPRAARRVRPARFALPLRLRALRRAAAPPDVEAGVALPPTDIEAAPPAGDALVVLRGLSKQFDNGVRAVSSLDLTLYGSEISVLLGHNGAGKSTVIAMLTGALAPTSGAINVCGLDISRQRGAARGMLGLCPQANVLFPLLTVTEHLRLFAVLKGVASRDVNAAVAELMQEVGLQDKAHTAAAALSGGMKRRLQLACALVGGSRVILLDEPTSGQDPVSRRQTWELLRRVRLGRAVLLTTHYLDEADLLADRVAVLSEGRLRAAGSPLFLKGRLGGGFTLSVSNAAAGAGDAAQLKQLVAAHVPDAVLLRAAGGELAWQAPAAQRGRFGALLATLERDSEALGVGSFGVSNATLEEVFLRIATEAPATVDAAAYVALAAPGASLEMMPIGAQNGVSDTAAPRMSFDAGQAGCLPGLKPRGAPLLNAGAASSSHEHSALTALEEPLPTLRDGAVERTRRRAFVEMLRKRQLIARRDYKSVLSQVALPVLAVALTLLILKLDINPVGPELPLSASQLVALSKVANHTPVWYPAGAPAAPGAPPDSFASGFAQPPLRLLPVTGADAYNSTSLSRVLLRHRKDEEPFRFGAFVPDDVELPRFTLGLCLASMSPQRGAAIGQALLSAVPVGPTPPPASAANVSARVGASALLAVRELAKPALNVLHNTSSVHALPIFLSELHAAQLRRIGGPELSASSHPLPLTDEELTTLAAFLRLLASFFVLIPFSYLPATYAAFVVRERAVGAKLQQLASGCGAVTYWLAAFVWEMGNHTAVVLACMVLFGAFQIDVLVGTWDKGLGIFLLLMLYGLAATPLSFCYSFLFDSHASAQVAIAVANFITGFCLVLSSFIMRITPDTVELNSRLVVLFRIFPPFCLGEGLIALATASFDFSSVDSAAGSAAIASNYTTAQGAAPRNSFGDFNLTGGANAFRWDVLGRSLLLLLAESCFFFVLTLLIELYGRRVAAAAGAAAAWPASALAQRLGVTAPPDAPRPKALLEPDPEVARELARLQASHDLSDAVEIRGVRKVYPPRGAAPAKSAVRDLWLGVRAGERFGLLGENGAGKTTLLSILCCDAAPTSGDAIVAGASILHAPTEVQRQIGYCPQRDPLLDLLSVREHLHLYARLKGMPERFVAAAAESTLRRVGLGPFAERLAGTLSGGNKRKLSLAIAIVGTPSVLLCDEPSSGMDPQARRNLWDVITFSTADMAVILTTHAMDEAEALCSRIGIMSQGELCCIGSATALKARYGDGHVIDVKANAGATEQLEAYLASALPAAVRTEQHAGKLRYALPRGAGVPLSRLFAVLEEAPAEDWAVGQSSLEAVFCTVAGASDSAAPPPAATPPDTPAQVHASVE